MVRTITVIFLCSIFFSCSKEENITHENLFVAGNPTPDYTGVSSILIENYINKVYIDLIGQKPSEIQYENAVFYLKTNALSFEAREKIITDVMKSQGYDDRLFQISSDLLLNGMDYSEIEQFQLEYIAIKNLVYAQGDTFTGQFFEYEIEKLQMVLDAPALFKNQTISLNEYYKRMSYNAIYDEVNMGSENFAISCFENLFKRYPTEEELTNGVSMVDGGAGILLRKSGRNKIEFLDIITQDSEFYQGRVLDAYKSLLLRTPNSEELTLATTKYQEGGSYKQVQIDITKSDEYAGFE